MFRHERPVRFQDVDAARIVFFAHYLTYCHEAMEAFFGAVQGGYDRIILKRGIGFPAVRVEIDYAAPLRYGDLVVIELDVLHVGGSSCTFRYHLRRGDGPLVATVKHVCVCCDLGGPTKVRLPDDVRAHLHAHLLDEANQGDQALLTTAPEATSSPSRSKKGS